jgi:hypothetical protein
MEQPVTYQEYRKQRMQGETLTLPSGLEVRVKRVSLLGLALDGQIPQTLHPLTDDLLSNGANVQIKISDLQLYGDLIAAVVKACVMDPPIADESDETHFAVRDMEPEDRTFIFNWANSGTKQVSPFRSEQARDVGALQPGNDAAAPVGDLAPVG